MPEWIAVVILGIIEGITEFLPVSSTGHLLLAEQWLPRQSDVFNVLVQCAAALAVVFIFAGRIKELLLQRNPETRAYLFKLCAAFALTVAGVLVIKKGNIELPERAEPVAWATLIGGVLFLILEVYLRGRPLSAAITWRVAAVAGAAQILAALFPGASRSGMTILAAMAVGTARPAATEFSFLLGVPTLFAAGGYTLLKEGFGTGGADAPTEWEYLLLGMFVSAIMAFIAVRGLLWLVQNHTFVGFGWYRIVLGGLILVAL